MLKLERVIDEKEFSEQKGFLKSDSDVYSDDGPVRMLERFAEF